MKLETESIGSVGHRLVKPLKLFVVVCMAGLFVLGSCKKDEEEETKLTITGDLIYDLPAYALAGQSLELYVNGITDPDHVTYKWTSAYLLTDTVSGSTCKITVPDSLGYFALTLTASADGYYDKTATKYVTSIKPDLGESLTGIPYPTDSIKDMRDEQWYYITEAGNLQWFAENLNWDGAGSAYAKADAIGHIVGRLYTWNEATGGVSASGLGQGPQGACPEGWSVPTHEDWEDLAKNLNGGVELPFASNWIGLGEKVMVDARFNENRIWPYTPNCTPENQFGWAALAGGSCTNNYNNYSGLFSYGFWWSASEMSSANAYYRYIYYNQPDFHMNYTDKDGFGASVRCVRLK